MWKLQIDSLGHLGSNQSFWDNFVWPLAVVIVTGLFLVFRKQLSKLVKKTPTKPIFSLKIAVNGEMTLVDGKHFESKIGLVRQLIRDNIENSFEVVVRPDFPTGNLNKFAKEELELKLRNKAEEFKTKLRILLMRPIEMGMEHSTHHIILVVNSILKGQPFNVTGMQKLDIYRNHVPSINFPVYLTEDEFSEIARMQGKTEEEIKRELLIPTFYSVSIFRGEVMYLKVIPSLVLEIYRIHTRHSFDLNTNHWENILGYEVGLG